MTLLTSDDYEQSAKKVLEPSLLDYINGAAFSEIADKKNKSAFDEIYYSPNVLVDVATTVTACELEEQLISAPLMIAPSAYHKLYTAHGEISTAQAAKETMLPMVVSMMSSVSFEEISKKTQHTNLWCQLYILKDRDLVCSLINRVSQAGFKGIMITVGRPCETKRYRDMRNNFQLPDNIKARNFDTISQVNIDPSITWDDIKWLQSISPLPVYLKGVLSPEDARRAVDLGVSGIVVSNHGGRQLDCATPSIIALKQVAEAVCGQLTLLLDGGVRRGSDIVKAYALGADAVMIGRPTLWALAVGGQKALSHYLSMLIEDVELVMKQSGCASLDDVRALKDRIKICQC